MGPDPVPPQTMSEGDLAGLLRVASRHPSVQIYVFGSTVHGPHPAHDIDIVLIYPSSDSLAAVLEDLDQLPLAPILDLTMMTPVESDQSGFLGRSRAVRLQHVAPVSS
ncbi:MULTISPECIES: nucleotidyltransferase domain-containing protein [unclassified Microbacterium]|uniref:nucleotidyltransferase domain-containing protein n=1 Tax=Microbacterium sp. K22 TaxID=2305447 RepID=UPI00109CF3AB